MRTEISRLQHALNVTTVYVTHDQTEAMTLGDRVAVMSNGVLQQYASPNELYGQPANLFVAGFIGSPAMNLFDGTIADGAVDTALGRIPLVDAVRRRLEHANADRDVVVGIRPEHIFDGPAVSDADGERYGFDADLEVVESLGSDVLVHFPIAQPEMAVQTAGAGDTGLAGFRLQQRELVARLGGNSALQVGQAKLWLDCARLQLFDRTSGENLLLG